MTHTEILALSAIADNKRLVYATDKKRNYTIEAGLSGSTARGISQFDDNGVLNPVLSAADATGRKTLSAYGSGGPDPGVTRVTQNDLPASILWMLMDEDVTNDASWMGVPYTTNPDGNVEINVQLVDTADTVSDANVLGQVNGRPTIGDGVTTGGRNLGLTSDLLSMTLTADASNAFTGYSLNEWAARGVIDANWRKNNNTITALYIGQGVTSIGSSAFYQATSLAGALNIPTGVTSIGGYAFYRCTGFTGNLILPDSLITIGDFAFNQCTALTDEIIIPNNVTSIGSYAFAYSTGFTGDLTLPNSLTSIGSYAFRSCSGLTNINCYTTLTIINATSDALVDTSITTIHARASDGTWSAGGSQTVGGKTGITVTKDL
jgi:hypothetical protein